MGMTDQEHARMVTEREEIRRKGRECPVPKAGGWVREWFGGKSGVGKDGKQCGNLEIYARGGSK